jgi:NADH dehydrogenase [ubiquinone] 1 alpha subcomplex assembly factor 7
VTLARRLADRIRAGGPISFADYVDAALYDPDAGFYSRGRPLGLRGAFSTAPTRQERFADAFAAEALSCHERLGRPATFVLVEVGPGDGTLARALAERLEGIVSELVLVERAEGMRARQEEALAASRMPVVWADSPGDVRAAPGFLVANELFDAVPFHLLRWPDEVVVGVGSDGELRPEQRPATAWVAAALQAEVEPRAGALYAVRPGAPALFLELVETVTRGRLLVADYGGEGNQVHIGREPVRTYVGGMRGADPLEAPGSQDITADVDFGPLRRAAREAGLRELAYEPQESWRKRLAPGSAGLFDPSPAALAAFKVLLLEKR